MACSHGRTYYDNDYFLLPFGVNRRGNANTELSCDSKRGSQRAVAAWGLTSESESYENRAVTFNKKHNAVLLKFQIFEFKRIFLFLNENNVSNLITYVK